MHSGGDFSAEYARLRQRTAPALLLERARSMPRAVALRAKRLGIYEEFTWADLADAVARCASALGRLGLRRGERVAILGDACAEWVICDLAVQAAGAISFGIYPTAAEAEVAFQLADAGASYVVAEDQEAVDKVLPFLDESSAIRAVVVIDTRAMFQYCHPKLSAYGKLLDAEPSDSSARQFEACVAALRPADPAFIVYTSGTTGQPKGALVSHGKHLAAAYTLVECFPLLGTGVQSTVAYLPLCHVLGRDVGITLPLLTRLVPHFGEDVEDLPATLFEVAPTVLFTVPRYLQKFAAQVLVGVEDTSALKRSVYHWAMAVGRRYIRTRWAGAPPLPFRAAYALAYRVAFGPILNRLGFDRLRLLLCGGAPLAPETMTLWQIYGVNVAEIYGQTETAGAVIAAQSAAFPRPGNLGRPPCRWEVRLDDRGEILARSPDLFEGYWNQPEATAQAIDPDGWLHTGDVGSFDADGRLRLVDRARDFMVTSGGKTLSPSHIEGVLRASPYISEAMAIGDSRKYVTALIEIEPDTVSEWARANAVEYTGFTSLAGHPEVVRLIAAEVRTANAQLARVEQVKAFRILPKVLDPEEAGEPVTPTRKLKRKQMQRRFELLVAEMYDSEEERRIAADVRDVLASADSAAAAPAGLRRDR